MELLKKLNTLSEKRIKYFLLNGDKMSWYEGSKTYWEYLENEIQEAKNEINTNKVYLEDELGDILWNYFCLLNSLKQEGKISSVEKVIERAYKKFSGRINEKDGSYNGNWQEIKNKQKEELKKEVKKIFSNLN